MEAIILAGGQGTRLRATVPDLPKPMAPINGRPFLSHQMDYWIQQGVVRFVLSVGYKREAIQDHFGDRYNGTKITYAIEEKPLGTGGGLLVALDKLRSSGPFLVLNGDTFFEVDLKKFQAFHLEKKAQLTMALLEIGVNSRYGGVKVGEGGKILSFRDGGISPCLINGGVYLFTGKTFSEKWEAGTKISLEDHLFPTFLQSGERFYGFRATGRFIDIGIPEDYYRAESMLGKQIS